MKTVKHWCIDEIFVIDHRTNCKCSFLAKVRKMTDFICWLQYDKKPKSWWYAISSSSSLHIGGWHGHRCSAMLSQGVSRGLYVATAGLEVLQAYILHPGTAAHCHQKSDLPSGGISFFRTLEVGHPQKKKKSVAFRMRLTKKSSKCIGMFENHHRSCGHRATGRTG